MRRELRIGIVGDWKPGYRGHVATDAALRHAAIRLGFRIENVWLSTTALDKAPDDTDLEAFNGFFMTPGTPYASLPGALRVLRFARERGWPLLATCGGFQHLLLEFAINAAGIADGEHGDYGVTGGTPVIVRVACPVPDRAPGAAALSGRIRVALRLPSQVFDMYGLARIDEEFACNWELNAAFRETLEKAGLRIAGFGEQGEVRATELPGHPFFVGVLFQPQLSSTASTPHPVIRAFCTAAQRFERPGRS